MGRKIPGKKHRGVKDPYKQHAERLAALKSKTNKTPFRPDEQPVPKTLIELMNWNNKKTKKEAPEEKKEKKSIKNKTIQKKTSIKNPSNPINKLQKLDGESKKSFSIRINEALKTLKKDATFKDIIEDLPKEPKNPNNDETRIIKKKKKKGNEIKLTKSQKRYQKEKLKKEQFKEKKEMDKLYVVKKDDIKFGEIVHEPPSLKIKPRKAEISDGAPRPARKDLLLNKLFESNSVKSVSLNKITHDSTLMHLNQKGFDLKGKRKELPDKIRRKLEESRKEAIEAYKKIKLMEKSKQKEFA